MRLRVPGIALLCLMFGIATASAATLDYTFTTVYSGTLGTTSFTDATIVITGSVDPADVHVGTSNNISNVVGTMMVSISGVGSYTFTDTMEWLTALNGVGISDDDAPFANIVIRDASVLAYNVNQAGSLMGGEGVSDPNAFNTTGGVLMLTGAPPRQTGTFVAVDPSHVPEPSSLALTLSGALGVLSAMRSRRC